jgi:hypothetical protein
MRASTYHNVGDYVKATDDTGIYTGIIVEDDYSDWVPLRVAFSDPSMPNGYRWFNYEDVRPLEEHEIVALKLSGVLGELQKR